MPLLGIIIIGAAIAVCLAFYVIYEIRRSREEFKKLDRSKLKNLDNDGWDNDH